MARCYCTTSARFGDDASVAKTAALAFAVRLLS